MTLFNHRRSVVLKRRPSGSKTAEADAAAGAERAADRLQSNPMPERRTKLVRLTPFYN